jgi:hypothetical protein
MEAWRTQTAIVLGRALQRRQRKKVACDAGQESRLTHTLPFLFEAVFPCARRAGQEGTGA